MITPNKLPCTAWLFNNGKVRAAVISELVGRNNLHAYARVEDSVPHILNLSSLFDSPEAAVWAEIESTTLEITRLRKLLVDCQERRQVALRLRDELKAKV